MQELEPWEMELSEIEATTSPEAMADEWALALALLGNVTEDRLEEFALKAHALCAEERDPGLREAVEERIDEIVLERRRG